MACVGGLSPGGSGSLAEVRVDWQTTFASTVLTAVLLLRHCEECWRNAAGGLFCSRRSLLFGVAAPGHTVR